MNIFTNPPAVATRGLLSACGLPTGDLDEQDFAHFFGCGTPGRMAGIVGLEIHGKAALLRSLAVSEEVRGRGCGKRLVAEAEAHAIRQGVSELYLLTTTARVLFERLGYSVAERNCAPAAIQATREFSSLCPASATFMVKKLDA